MQSKQDQLQAHLFVVGRVVSALTRGEPDAAETPMRRFTTATLGSVVVAALLLVGFGVYGLVRPGSGTAWREPGTVIVEEETGTRYVLMDKVLHPVLNYASARLLLGSAAKVVQVPQRSLGGVPRGAPVGIPGAPDGLPDPTRLGGRQWTLCSAPAPDAAGSPAMRTTVSLDRARPLTSPSADQAVLVQTPGGAQYLVWHDTRLGIPDRAALVALGYGSADPWQVSDQWLSALPSGPALRAPAVPHRGKSGPRIRGQATRIGQVLSVGKGTGGPTSSYFLVLADGLAPLTGTQAALLLGDPASRQAYTNGQVTAVAVGASDAAAMPVSGQKVSEGALPLMPPALVGPLPDHPWTPCLRLVLGQDGVLATVRMGFTEDRSAADTGVVRVLVAPGGGMLAQSPATHGAPSSAVYLVTDLGVKYPLVSSGSAAALGYSDSPVVLVPAALLALLPTGPVLDPKAAEREPTFNGEH
ncbi:type VII secretion protein EccB [Streptomyces sp. NPDC002573]|uniref:type VII secretion protein EccB n=1 Tax=Streptomyces sp. NPDC002573 TaxID=3364651 RepID=UPI0036B5EC9B